MLAASVLAQLFGQLEAVTGPGVEKIGVGPELENGRWLELSVIG